MDQIESVRSNLQDRIYLNLQTNGDNMTIQNRGEYEEFKINLSNLSQATEQEVFDQVAVHLLTQNKQSASKEGVCAYRGVDGLMCAAGCLISDDEYPQIEEGTSWGDLVAIGVVPREHQHFIQALQDIHDGWQTSLWYDQLVELADDYGLNTDKINQFKIRSK